MIIDIDKKDRDIFEKNCASISVQCDFYTIETNARMIRAVVLSNGREISVNEAYNIGKCVGMEKVLKSI